MLTRDTTPPAKPCACGLPAVTYINGIPMCAKHALLAEQQKGR
jgi:hypothetical protein